MRRIPLANRVVLGLSVNLKTLDLLDHSSLGHGLCRRSGDGTKWKRRTDGKGGDNFHER
jgi:hypothetical protein